MGKVCIKHVQFNGNILKNINFKIKWINPNRLKQFKYRISSLTQYTIITLCHLYCEGDLNNKKEVVWPWFEIAFTSTLELGLRGQPFPRPLAVLDCIIPRHMYNRVIHSGIHYFSSVNNQKLDMSIFRNCCQLLSFIHSKDQTKKYLNMD